MDLVSPFSDQPLLTPGHGEQTVTVTWKRNKRGKLIDFFDTVKSMLVISHHSSAPSTTIKSTAECQEQQVSVLVRSVTSAKCTLALGFSTAEFSDPEAGRFWEEELNHTPPIQMFLSPKNILLGAQAYLPCTHVLCPTRAITGAKLSMKQSDSDPAYPGPQHGGQEGSGRVRISLHV